MPKTLLQVGFRLCNKSLQRRDVDIELKQVGPISSLMWVAGVSSEHFSYFDFHSSPSSPPPVPHK